jgi:hypothetical protein
MACVVRVEGKVDDVYLIHLNKHFIRQFPFLIQQLVLSTLETPARAES